jgi:hypothetical protein
MYGEGHALDGNTIAGFIILTTSSASSSSMVQPNITVQPCMKMPSRELSDIEDAERDAQLSRRTPKRPGPTSLKMRPRLRAG